MFSITSTPPNGQVDDFEIEEETSHSANNQFRYEGQDYTPRRPINVQHFHPMASYYPRPGPSRSWPPQDVYLTDHS